MDQQFVDSYRHATLERDDKFLRGRWKLVAEISSMLSPSGALELIRVFLDLPSYDRSSIATLLDAVKDPGPLYSRPEVTMELRLLAGAILNRLLRDPTLRATRIADLTSVALICCRKWLPTTVVSESFGHIFEMALEQIMERAVWLRQIPDGSPRIDVRIPEFPSAALSSKDTVLEYEIPIQVQDRYGSLNIQKHKISIPFREIDAVQFAGWNKEVNRKLQQFATEVTIMINTKIQESLAIFPRMRSILLEENNILWWLFGEASNTSKKLFSQIGLPILYIVIANELSMLTQQTPGPAAAIAYIDRALRSGRKVLPEIASVAELISAVSADSRPSWQNHMRPQLADLCPITQSICAGVDMSAKQSGRYAMDLSPVEFTFQLYQEMILHRLHREVVG